MKKSNKLSSVALLCTAVIWGLAFSAQKQGAEVMSPLFFNGIRFVLGALALLPAAVLLERKRGIAFGKLVRAGIMGGALLFVAGTLQQYGIDVTKSASKAGFITGLYIIFVPLFGFALRRRPRGTVWLGIALALAGLYFISVPAGGLDAVGWGDMLLLVGAMFWALHILLIDLVAVHSPPLQFSVAQFVVCAALSLVFLPMDEAIRRAVGWRVLPSDWSALSAGLWPLLYCGVLSVGVAYTLQVVGQRRVEPNRAALIFSFETVFAAVGAVVFLHETLTWREATGGALIFLGLLASSLPAIRRPLPINP